MVTQANDAGSRGLANLRQGGDEDGRTPTGQHLGGSQGGVGTTTVLIDVAKQVRIPEQQEDGRHCEAGSIKSPKNLVKE